MKFYKIIVIVIFIILVLILWNVVGNRNPVLPQQPVETQIFLEQNTKIPEQTSIENFEQQNIEIPAQTSTGNVEQSNVNSTQSQPNAINVVAPGYNEAQRRLQELKVIRQKAIEEQEKSLEELDK